MPFTLCLLAAHCAPFIGRPRLLSRRPTQAVVARCQRPAWPAVMGPEFLEAKKLAEACWQHNPQAR